MKRTAILTMGIVAAGALVAQQFLNGTAAQAQEEQPFEVQFWNYIKDSGYKNWSPWPKHDPGFYKGSPPHGAFLKTYVNRKVTANPQNPPHGSIIVKENYAKDKQKLMAITVMYRTEGFDPDHNDWYWVKYTPDGKVARTPPEKGKKRIAGQFKSCINCHSGAQGDDFIFINDPDEKKPPAPKGDKKPPKEKKNKDKARNEKTASGSKQPAAVVTMKGVNFKPKKITVTAGQTVKWSNTSEMVHTVTADPELAKKPKKHVALPEKAKTFHSGKLQPGDTFSRAFQVPGTYRYFCVPHELAGMLGTITVKPADAAKKKSAEKPKQRGE